MIAHNGNKTNKFDLWDGKFKNHTFKQLDKSTRTSTRLLCTYCNSLTLEDTLKAFKIPGVRWAGADWKYGYPHKLYIEIPCTPYRRCTSSGPGPNNYAYSTVNYDNYKFYMEHLLDASKEQLQEWNKTVKPLTGIGFNFTKKGELKYNAPCHNYQAWGTIEIVEKV